MYNPKNCCKYAFTLINGQPNHRIAGWPILSLKVKILNGIWIRILAGKTNKTNEAPLPLTTVIVDGTTYYASQTINGIESIERLAVTVKSG
jgi:hypothetical protein